MVRLKANHQELFLNDAKDVINTPLGSQKPRGVFNL